jgi:RNA polymerase sigma-70 factor (ECF subfamily)
VKETEQQLLAQVSKGDRKAYRRLYERFAPYCMSTAMRYLGEADEVHDAVQEGFVKVFSSLGTFRHHGEGSLKAWICAIVAHEACNILKQHQQHLFSDITAEPIDEDTEEQPEVEHVPPDVLTQLIRRLPPGYRMVLNLYVFEELSHQEIGRRLDITPQSSASQFSRAKKLLAQLIKDYIKTGKI